MPTWALHRPLCWAHNDRLGGVNMDQEIIVAGLALVGSLSGTYLPTAGHRPYRLPAGAAGKEGEPTQFRDRTAI